jgi:hypothetical protein
MSGPDWDGFHDTVRNAIVLGVATALCLAFVSGASRAQNYSVSLGGRVVGTLDHRDEAGGGARLATLFNDTPLGVGDGMFDATSRPARAADGTPVRTYSSVASRKDRRIDVDYADGGRVVSVVVTPAEERTALSDPAAVPAGVFDPVAAFGRIASARDCPPAFRYYDGRRVVQIVTRERTVDGNAVSCRADYDVIAGPGHLSPFRFTHLRLEMVYDARGADAGLRSLEMRTGPFALTLDRRD